MGSRSARGESSPMDNLRNVFFLLVLDRLHFGGKFGGALFLLLVCIPLQLPVHFRPVLRIFWFMGFGFPLGDVALDEIFP